MPKPDPQARATKQDITLLMNEIGKLYDANERWKEELKLHFDTVAENLVADFRGALSDKIDQHETRIVRLERHTGIRAA